MSLSQREEARIVVALVVFPSQGTWTLPWPCAQWCSRLDKMTQCTSTKTQTAGANGLSTSRSAPPPPRHYHHKVKEWNTSNL